MLTNNLPQLLNSQLESGVYETYTPVQLAVLKDAPNVLSVLLAQKVGGKVVSGGHFILISI